jgi:hypothetical protein
MNLSEALLPYSIEGFLTDDEVDRVVASIEAYKKTVDARLLEAGAKGYSIHQSIMSVSDVVQLYEPAGRLEINWQDLPRESIEIVENAFYRRVEDIRRAYPTAFGPMGFTYVEYHPGQYFTSHVDGIGSVQVAGFGVTLTDDFEGGEFCVETCGSGRLWAMGHGDRLMAAPGHDSSSDWFRSLPRTVWTTRPKRGNAIFYGSGLTHSSKPVTRGVLKKLLAFVHADPY